MRGLEVGSMTASMRDGELDMVTAKWIGVAEVVVSESSSSSL